MSYDPLETRERRVALLENLACRLNDMKAVVGVGFPRKEVQALVALIVEQRAECQRARVFRSEGPR